MIKGVNKQIIEIKCPKDERFEKILLFVNSREGSISGGRINEKAKLAAKSFLEKHPELYDKKQLSKTIRGYRITIGLCAAAAAATVFYIFCAGL